MTLIAVNFALLGVLTVLSYDLPAAYAQRAAPAGGSNYLAITALYTSGTDAVWILHTGKHLLTVLAPDATTAELRVIDTRDVAQDLGIGGNQTP